MAVVTALVNVFHICMVGDLPGLLPGPGEGYRSVDPFGNGFNPEGMAICCYLFIDRAEFHFNPVGEIWLIVDAYNPYTQFRIHSEQFRQ